MTKDNSGTSFRFEGTPDTSPIVLIHGVGLDQNIWQALLSDTKRQSTLTYDLLGHGETDEPLGEQSFQPFVVQLLRLLLELGIPKIVLVGFSLGGQVAKHFAVAYPETVQNLVLISTTFQRTPEERQAMFRRVEQAENGDQPGLEQAALERWFSAEYLAANPDVERQISERLQKNDPAKFLESYRLLSNAEDHSIDYGSLNVPTLILTGDGDPGSTPKMALAMAQAMPNARAEVIYGAKHLGIIEKHGAFSDAIISFLSESS